MASENNELAMNERWLEREMHLHLVRHSAYKPDRSLAELLGAK